ncbi:MAG: PilZ domain-containing protein [Xanthobacteraceae bacterium]|jgi:PilZ domain
MGKRTELRKKPRRQFHYNAKIMKDKDTPLLRCAISDVSDSGARLSLAAEAELPDKFLLLLTTDGGAHRQCRVIWRDGLTLGVKFPDNR